MKTEYRHLIKGSETSIAKGKKATKQIKLPPDVAFADSFLYQIGIGEKTVGDAIILSTELWDWYNTKIK